MLVGIALGLALGGVGGWLLGRVGEAAVGPRADAAAARARADEIAKWVAQLDAALETRERDLGDARQRSSELTERLVRATAELDGERRSASDRLKLLEQAEQTLREAFASVSAEALRANNQSFLQLAKASLSEFQKQAVVDLDHRQRSIDSLVKPLHETLGQVDAKLQQVEKERASSDARLNEQLQTLATSTSNLERALQTPHVRGGWGEVQLRRVVELAGMLDHCDFSEKTTAQTVEGRLVPDMVVNLPGGRHIIIDAKVPYVAYRQAVEATGDDERAARLKEHAGQVKAHMVELGSRGYWAQFQPAPEFVFMFLPGEGYFSAALQHDPGLIEFGVTQRVIPASPLTLIALLRAVAYGWQQERIARNAEEVSALGRELYERIWRLAGHLDDLAKGLTRTVEAYNRTVGTIESRVLVTARRFKELGVSAAEPIPEVPTVERTPRPLQAPEMTDLFGAPDEPDDEDDRDRD
ncbi:MAG: DNA recombination protein RmuC [Vicinamibacterales bacterium]|nr:DNA recombination protein RmuC [Vicinamibacterales bacterium]